MTSLAGDRTELADDGDDPTFAALLDAAVQVIGQRGYHGTSVRDIADAAGVSAGSLYNHFGSKHELLVVILDRGLDQLIAASEQALYDAPADPVSRLRALVDAHVTAHARRPLESYIGNSELRSLSAEARALIVSKRDAQQRMFARVIRDGVNRGVFTASDPAAATRFIVTACTAVASWYRPGGRSAIPDLVRDYQALSLRCLGYREGERDG